MIELVCLICFHNFFISQFQLLLMFFFHISLFMLDYYYINQVFLINLQSIISFDLSFRFKLIIIVIKFRHMYNKITEQVAADKKYLHMNIFSMLQIIDTMFSAVLSVIMFLHHLVIDADKHALFLHWNVLTNHFNTDTNEFNKNNSCISADFASLYCLYFLIMMWCFLTLIILYLSCK